MSKKQQRISKSTKGLYDQNKDALSVQSDNADLIQKTILKPELLNPKDMTSLQRAIGNQRLGFITKMDSSNHIFENESIDLDYELSRTGAIRKRPEASQRETAQGQTMAKNVQLSPLSEELRWLWNPNNKAPFFNRLRSLRMSDPDLLDFVRTLPGDDRFLAENIVLYSADDSMWPIDQRVRLVVKPWFNNGGKGKVFDILRDANGKYANDRKLTNALNSIFTAGSEDLKLARKLQLHGPEDNWPPVLPNPVNLNLNGSVGSGGRNQSSDVRAVQERLRVLEFLSVQHYAAEQVDPNAVATLSDADIPHTIEAIRRFQATAVGNRSANGDYDARVDPGGLTERVLNDPTYGTRTTINPNAANPQAGVPVPTNLGATLTRLVNAIETHEAGGVGRRGERPAVLRNASGTPATFGQAQVAAGSAMDTMRLNPNLATHYGLSNADRRSMNAAATQTRIYYNRIYRQEVQQAFSEAILQNRIRAYIAQHSVIFHANTGLADEDIEGMFRAAQLRRQLAGHTVQHLNVLLHNNDINQNITALRLSRSDIRRYLDRPRRHGEHRQGFITKALFTHSRGQALRNAMTDNSGLAMGRYRVRDSWNLVRQRANQLNVNLTPIQHAEITAYSHNHGPAQVNNLINNPNQSHNDQYVQNVMAHW